MKYIQNIDFATQNKTQLPDGRWVVAKPLEASGLLAVYIRIICAVAVLRGKAEAFTYTER